MDGAIAMINGESLWISGEHARADVQKLRAQSGAIMTGSGTVLNDNPALTVRDDSLNKNQPLRVILASQLNNYKSLLKHFQVEYEKLESK